ncbi:ATP-binding protein, partial [SAR202 cluster bacterium AD-812-D07_MRT_10900m]|nr:ATP-binding protein [SAR202 cluster bacterium AD-812-D07_MRT_10900m]
MTQSNLVEYGLDKNPFPLEPDMTVKFWAGREEIKRNLLDVVESPLYTDIGGSEFVVLHGSLGAGKSHALRYLTGQINDARQDHYHGHAIYLRTAKVAQKVSFVEIYKHLIQELGRPKIKEVASQLKEKLETSRSLIREENTPAGAAPGFAPDAGFVDTILFDGFHEQDRLMIRILETVATETDSNALAYLFGESKSISSVTGAPVIDSDFQAVRTFGAFLRTLTTPIMNQGPVWNAAYLFIDEVETLLDERPADLTAFFHSIRELVNELPYGFCLLMAYTAQTALLEAMIPEAVQERFTRQYIELPALESGEAKEFIAKQMSEFRPESFENTNKFHPFTAEAVDV